MAESGDSYINVVFASIYNNVFCETVLAGHGPSVLERQDAFCGGIIHWNKALLAEPEFKDVVVHPCNLQGALRATWTL